MFLESSLADGTLRQALALEGEALVPSAAAACPVLARAAPSFRELIDDASGAILTALDSGLGTRGGSMLAVRSDATKLEHLVAYSPTQSGEGKSATSEAAMPLHVDEGLFIAFAPALLAGRGDAEPQEDRSLLLQLPSGELVIAAFPDPASVVFMIGDGFRRWMPGEMLAAALVVMLLLCLPRGPAHTPSF